MNAKVVEPEKVNARLVLLGNIDYLIELERSYGSLARLKDVIQSELNKGKKKNE